MEPTVRSASASIGYWCQVAGWCYFNAWHRLRIEGTRIPVIPCRIWGAFESLPAGKHVPRPRSMRVRMGAPLVFDTIEDSREGWTSIAGQLRDAVLGMG